MKPFEKIRVLDLTHVIAGPFCAYQLGLLGADVIKVEPPTLPDSTRHLVPGNPEPVVTVTFATQNANKRAVVVDLKSERGKEVFHKLVASADVIVENYRAGVLDKLGLGYEDLSKVNPRLIYCSISGFGQTGPKRGHAAYDPVIQAISGLMSITGTPETAPLKVGTTLVDSGTGIIAAFAVASALFQREQTGKGQRIDVSMMDAAMVLMSGTVSPVINEGKEAHALGNFHESGSATYTSYDTKDGKIMLGAATVRQRRRLWEALGCPDLAKEAEQLGRWGAKKVFPQEHAKLKEILPTRTAEEWVALLNPIAVPAERILSIAEAAAHDQAKARESYKAVPDKSRASGQLTLPLSGFKYGHGGPEISKLAPRYGEHSREILSELGYSQSEIAALIRDRAVMPPA